MAIFWSLKLPIFTEISNFTYKKLNRLIFDGPNGSKTDRNGHNDKSKCDRGPLKESETIVVLLNVAKCNVKKLKFS